MPMDDLMEWEIFRRLEKPTLHSIKLAHVFNNASSALIVDHDDQVYKLTLAVPCKIITRSIVLEEICGRGIVQFATGPIHFMAVSKDGKLYGWGDNQYNQLGDGSCTSRNNPHLVSNEIGDRLISMVACGSFHTVVLTTDKEAIAFGRSDNGQCGTQRSVVTCNVVMKKAISVVASGQVSACLCEDGLVHVWGFDGKDIISPTSPTSGTSSPQPFMGEKIAQIEMGKNQSIALTTCGLIFSWVHNKNQGQLQTQGFTFGRVTLESTSDSPQRATQIAKVKENGRPVNFVKIATHNESNISAAMSTGGVVYVWGHQTSAVTGVQYADDPTGPNVPIKTPLKTLNQVFATMEKPPTGTYKNISVTASLFHKITKTFDDPNQCDCQFMINGRVIHAQKFILGLKSKYLANMLNGGWSESEGIIHIKNYSYTAYYAFLKFLYTDCMEASDEVMLELLELAHEVMQEDLLDKCQERTVNSLSLENVCDVFKVANKLRLKDLLEHCRLFTLPNWQDAFMSDSYERLTREEAFEFRHLVCKGKIRE